ncbi:MAG: hypothetical protein U0736_17185 [Gemmataceae bacterium]
MAAAELPLHVLVEDLAFAIHSSWLYRTRPGETPRTIRLFDAGLGWRPTWRCSPGSPCTGGARPRDCVCRTWSSSASCRSALRRADGGPLREGDTVTLRAMRRRLRRRVGRQGAGTQPRGHHPHRRPRRAGGRVEPRAGCRIQQELVQAARPAAQVAKVKEIDTRLRQGGKVLPERQAAEAEAAAQKAAQDARDEADKAQKADTADAREAHRQKAEAAAPRRRSRTPRRAS